jgi:hypothetical protein
MPPPKQSLSVQADQLRRKLTALLENIPKHPPPLLTEWNEEFSQTVVSDILCLN